MSLFPDHFVTSSNIHYTVDASTQLSDTVRVSIRLTCIEPDSMTRHYGPYRAVAREASSSFTCDWIGIAASRTSACLVSLGGKSGMQRLPSERICRAMIPSEPGSALVSSLCLHDEIQPDKICHHVRAQAILVALLHLPSENTSLLRQQSLRLFALVSVVSLPGYVSTVPVLRGKLGAMGVRSFGAAKRQLNWLQVYGHGPKLAESKRCKLSEGRLFPMAGASSPAVVAAHTGEKISASEKDRKIILNVRQTKS